MMSPTGNFALRHRVSYDSAGFKLLLWIGTIGLVCTLIEWGSFLCGFQISILKSGNGRSILVVVSLISLLMIMSRDRRPLTEFGIAVPDDWRKQSFRGWLYGFSIYSMIIFGAFLTGAMEFNAEQSSIRQVRKSLEAFITAWPLAACEQVIFSAYMLYLLRAVAGRIGGILLCAGAFTTIMVLGKSSEEIATSAWCWLLVNLSLASVIFSIIRMETGSIVFPTGILAGVLMSSRLFHRSGLLEPTWTSEMLVYFAPHNNPQMSPLLGIVLVLSAIAATIKLVRHGEMPVITGPAISADFKKFFPFSILSALAPIDLWIRELNRAQWKIGFIYLPRLTWILLASTINSIVTFPERLVAPLMLKHQVSDPVLIVGVQRSGTTHLHNLLAQDRQYVVPRNFHVINPHGMLFMGWLITPLLGLFMTMRRPMDAVEVNLLTPQEEEFAIASMTSSSPYWGFYLPQQISRYERQIYPAEMTSTERENWRNAMLLFLRKLTFWKRKSPLLKSPYNTARVAEFSSLFPNLKVIHICRNPCKTYLSNLHLAREGLVAFQLQEQQENGYSERFLTHYRRIEDTFHSDIKNLPEHSVASVRYEDLIQNPVSEIRRLYGELELPYTMTFHRQLENYVANLSDYRTNQHPELSSQVEKQLNETMGEYIDSWGYRDLPNQQSKAA